MRAAIAALIALAAIVGVRVAATEDDGYPLIAIPQGITPFTFEGKRVFVVRAGEVFTVFSARSGRIGKPVRWCPRERAFWAPGTNDLFAPSGKYAFGGVNHDMIQYPKRVSNDGLLQIDLDHPIVRPRSGDGRKEIDPAVFEFYQRYLNYDPTFPTPTRPVFCPNPLT